MADPPSVLTLLVQKGPRQGETRRVRAGAALRVGRVAKGNDLAVRDAGASESHLCVEFLKPPAARWTVTDLASSNGTLLNGAPVTPTIPAPLSDGDLIKVGEITVLSVSISVDERLGPAPAATRRSARNAAAAAAEEEQAPAVTRRAGRKKAAAVEAPRRGGPRKAAATAALPLDDGVQEEDNDKREASGGSGEEGLVEECTGISSLENMTLGEWFVRIEKYLLAKNEAAAEKAIAEVREKHRRFYEHLKTINKGSDPS